MIERKITVPVELTPEELAFEFCRMNGDDQAKFFSELAAITEKWERPFCLQLQFIIDNENLTQQGRRVMEQIGAYGENIQ